MFFLKVGPTRLTNCCLMKRSIFLEQLFLKISKNQVKGVDGVRDVVLVTDVGVVQVVVDVVEVVFDQ